MRVGTAIVREERGTNFRADFESGRADCRTEPGDEVAGAHAKVIERGDGTFENTRRESAPAGMRDADGGAMAIRQQHGKAVRDEHGAHDAAFTRDRGIRGFRNRIALRSLNCHGRSVNLRQPAGFGGQDVPQPASIFGECIVGVPGVRPEVHRRERSAAHAAMARRHERVHAGGHRPIGHDPIEARRRDPLRKCRKRCRIHAVDFRSRSDASSATISAGSAACHSQALPVAGWTRPSRAACSACRANAIGPRFP